MGTLSKMKLCLRARVSRVSPLTRSSTRFRDSNLQCSEHVLPQRNFCTCTYGGSNLFASQSQQWISQEGEKPFKCHLKPINTFPLTNKCKVMEMVKPALQQNFNLGCISSVRRFGTDGSSYPLTNAVNESSGDFLPVDISEIKAFLDENNLTFSDGYTCIATSCARHKGKRAFKNKVFINMTTGYFVCVTCGKSGNWCQFKDNTQSMLSVVGQKDQQLPNVCHDNMQLEEDSADAKHAAALWEKAKPILQLSEEEWDGLQHDLQITGLEMSTLDKFQVRALADSGRRGLVLPLLNLTGSIIGVKTVSVETRNVSGKNKKMVVTRTIPRVNYSGLFGLNGEKRHSSTKAIITSNEFDAMAIHQRTGKMVFSLPKADSILPQKVLPYLEKLKEIIIWLGGDAKTWESAKQFARKLNETRCYLIRPSMKHPNALACLQKDICISGALKQAHPAVHKSIISFRDLRRDVYEELAQAEQVVGVKWKRYTQLNKLLKGHRRGELTVFTGPTGAGKTTFISDYSLDLALRGVNTLWGSFEINNVRLMKTMITQFSQTNLSRKIEEFDHWADKFEELPFYFMTFHGQEEIKSVIETMSHAVYVHDIAHVVVDNLQFMMGVDDTTDRFVKQDKVISAFRRFATNNNCHVTLVVHPRKERDTEDLTISSIFGGAKASQEADNILILQDKRLQTVRGKKYIQVAKNRFDGDLGVMMLEFDKDALSFAMKKNKSEKAGTKTEVSDVSEKPIQKVINENEVLLDQNIFDIAESSQDALSRNPSSIIKNIEVRLMDVKSDHLENHGGYHPSMGKLKNDRLEIKEYHAAGSKNDKEVIDYVLEEEIDNENDTPDKKE